jgi:hypothetical protein
VHNTLRSTPETVDYVVTPLPSRIELNSWMHRSVSRPPTFFSPPDKQHVMVQSQFSDSVRPAARAGFMGLCCRQHKLTYVAQGFMWRSPPDARWDGP